MAKQKLINFCAVQIRYQEFFPFKHQQTFVKSYTVGYIFMCVYYVILK